MKSYNVEFSDAAWAKLEAQATFIAQDRQAPINAARWINRLIAAADSLSVMPGRHTLDESRTQAVGEKVYRMVFERTYLLFYTIDDEINEVLIVAFEHGSRQQGR